MVLNKPYFLIMRHKNKVYINKIADFKFYLMVSIAVKVTIISLVFVAAATTSVTKDLFILLITNIVTSQ